VAEAKSSGARLNKVCAVLGVDTRTVQRWRSKGGGEDLRKGPNTPPANKLTPSERAHVIAVANSPENRDLSPKQIVPRLADEGTYIASESTFFRVLREEGMQRHRENSRPATHHRPNEIVATGPNLGWSWDITYMKSSTRGLFFYLYMIVDIWSRKIVGWQVHERESEDLAAELARDAVEAENVDPSRLRWHSDNGGPMKGSTMLATLQALGIVPSFSRPHVSDDNPYSEALFRTLKYRPEYPRRPFESLGEARAWVAAFVDWYNDEHRHSAIRFVTPAERHTGRDHEVLARRAALYEEARARHPERWTTKTRNWEPAGNVVLNPEKTSDLSTQLAVRSAA
jgi:putative transposase